MKTVGVFHLCWLFDIFNKLRVFTTEKEKVVQDKSFDSISVLPANASPKFPAHHTNFIKHIKIDS
jgi:hypothetical protein